MDVDQSYKELSVFYANVQVTFNAFEAIDNPDAVRVQPLWHTSLYADAATTMS